MANLSILYYYIFNISVLFCTTIVLSAQSVTLNNPSFEDSPGDAVMPMGWFECSDYTTPDILPGYWGVYGDASEGETYVGIITRENGSFESFGQRLSTPLATGACYSLKFDVAHSKSYAGYNDNAKLNIWLAEKKCGRQQLIYESEAISNEKWKEIYVKFQSEIKAKYIIIEIRHLDTPKTTKANVLLDNMSPILECNKA